MTRSILSRRSFIKSSATVAASLAGTHKLLGEDSRAVSPNERLRLGFIGVGGVGQGRGQEHLNSAMCLQLDNGSVEVAAVCDVFKRYRDETAERVRKAVGKAPMNVSDYRDIINDSSIDAVCIATPDHWHARQTLEALAAGKHVYCEKPMTHSVEESLEVLREWKRSGQVMQVGVQSTQLPVWRDARERICNGQLGKVLGYQTEYFRNSDVGQWRYYPLTLDMTPKHIDWKMFLGSDLGLAPDMPFDRAKFGQWRCYWEFGSGVFTDLFVHRTTSMLAATGLRFPARVVGAGGIYLEYDGRDVPDVATVVADFPEGAQGLVTATMCCSNTPLHQSIRGHHGSFVFGVGEEFEGYDFVAERPQVTHNSKIKSERIDVGSVDNTSFAHFKNFCEAAAAGNPDMVACSPELGAAAMVIVGLGSRSYRMGKVFHFDPNKFVTSDGDASWAKRWEQRSAKRSPALHTAGWRAGTTGSLLFPKEYQKLAGQWTNSADPASGEKREG